MLLVVHRFSIGLKVLMVVQRRSLGVKVLLVMQRCSLVQMYSFGVKVILGSKCPLGENMLLSW